MRNKLILIFTFLFVSDLISQINDNENSDFNNLKLLSNEEVVFDLFKSNLSDFIKYYKNDSVLITDIQIVSGDKYIEKYFEDFFDKNVFIYKKGNDFTNRKIVIDVKELKVSYPVYVNSGLFGNKSFLRNVKSDFDIKYFNLNEDIPLYSNNIKINFSDTVKIENSSRIVSYNYPFLNAKLPEENFLNKFLIPAGLILASVTAIVLFFIIRSN